MGFLGVRSTPKNPSKLFLPPPRCARGRVGEGKKLKCAIALSKTLTRFLEEGAYNSIEAIQKHGFSGIMTIRLPDRPEKS